MSLYIAIEEQAYFWGARFASRLSSLHQKLSNAVFRPGKVGFEFYGNVSAPFKEGVVEAYEKIPENVKQSLANEGLSVLVGETRSSITPYNPSYLPSVFDPRYNANQISGAYAYNPVFGTNWIELSEYYYNPMVRPDVRPIDINADPAQEQMRFDADFLSAAQQMKDLTYGKVNETLIDTGTVIPVSVDQAASTLYHEIGHHIFFNKAVNADASYWAAYAADIDLMGGRDAAIANGFGYYLQEGETGGDEAFASSVSYIMQPRPDRLSGAQFPNTNFWTNSLLQNYDSYKGPYTHDPVSGYLLSYPQTHESTITQRFNSSIGEVFIKNTPDSFSLTGNGFSISTANLSSPVTIIDDQAGILTIKGNQIASQTFSSQRPSLSMMESGDVCLLHRNALTDASQINSYGTFIKDAFPELSGSANFNTVPVVLHGSFKSFNDAVSLSYTLSRPMAVPSENEVSNLSLLGQDFSANQISAQNRIRMVVDDHLNAVKFVGHTSTAALPQEAGMSALGENAPTRIIPMQSDPLHTGTFTTSPVEAPFAISDSFTSITTNELGFCPSLGLVALAVSGAFIYAKNRNAFVGSNRAFVSHKVQTAHANARRALGTEYLKGFFRQNIISVTRHGAKLRIKVAAPSRKKQNTPNKNPFRFGR